MLTSSTINRIVVQCRDLHRSCSVVWAEWGLRVMVWRTGRVALNWWISESKQGFSCTQIARRYSDYSIGDVYLRIPRHHIYSPYFSKRERNFSLSARACKSGNLTFPNPKTSTCMKSPPENVNFNSRFPFFININQSETNRQTPKRSHNSVVTVNCWDLTFNSFPQCPLWLMFC